MVIQDIYRSPSSSTLCSQFSTVYLESYMSVLKVGSVAVDQGPGVSLALCIHSKLENWSISYWHCLKSLMYFVKVNRLCIT